MIGNEQTFTSKLEISLKTTLKEHTENVAGKVRVAFSVRFEMTFIRKCD